MPYAHRGCERVIRKGPHPLGVQPYVHGLSSVLIVVDYPGVRPGWWPACSRRHGPNLGAHVVGFELRGERGVGRGRDAPQVLKVGTAGDASGGLDVLGGRAPRVGGVQSDCLVIGYAGRGVFGCARVR